MYNTRNDSMVIRIKIRCEHNCHLCKKAYLGRCFGKFHGKDVSVDDMPICEEYEYSGTEKHLQEINQAIKLGITYLDINELYHFKQNK